MTVSEYLGQGTRLVQRILYCTQRIGRLRAMADGVAAVRTDKDKVDGSGGGDPAYVRILEQIWEAEDEIRRAMELQLRLQAQIRKVLSQLLNTDYRVALAYHYLEGLSWEAVADRMGVHRRTVLRWADKGRSIIVLPEDAIRV